MLVSVVIGALNEENYIGQTIESLKKQKTRHEFEIIVGDGYSEDATVKIAKKLGAKVVLEKNRSAAWERQAAAKIAKGEVIAFTDADAVVPPDWVEKIAKEFHHNKKIAMVYGPVYFSDTPSWEKSFSKILMTSFLSITAFFGFHNCIGSNLAVRRSVFEKIGGFDTNLVTAEDIDLAKRIRGNGKLVFSKEIFLNVSARRVKKWGYIRYALFHMVNALRYQFFKKPVQQYEPVR